MLTAADRQYLKDDIEYQMVIGKGEEKGQISLSAKATIKGTILFESARTQNEKGGVNVVPVISLITNAILPINSRINAKGSNEIFKIDLNYRKASRLSGLNYYQISRV